MIEPNEFPLYAKINKLKQTQKILIIAVIILSITTVFFAYKFDDKSAEYSKYFNEEGLPAYKNLAVSANDYNEALGEIRNKVLSKHPTFDLTIDCSRADYASNKYYCNYHNDIVKAVNSDPNYYYEP